MGPEAVLLGLVNAMIQAGLQKIADAAAQNRPLTSADWKAVVASTNAAVDANRALDPK